MMKRTLVMLFLALAMIAAACGDTDPQADTNAPGAGTGTDTPVAAGACAVGVTDCDDTVVAGSDCAVEVTDCDDAVVAGTDDDVIATGGGDAVTGFVVDGGLTVSEALATDATGVLAVKGYLFGDEQGFRLCEVLAESFPPQCGGESLPLGNFDQASVDNLPVDENNAIEENQGITWSDNYMTLFGEIVEGTLMIDTGVIG